MYLYLNTKQTRGKKYIKQLHFGSAKGDKTSMAIIFSCLVSFIAISTIAIGGFSNSNNFSYAEIHTHIQIQYEKKPAKNLHYLKV